MTKQEVKELLNSVYGKDGSRTHLQETIDAIHQTFMMEREASFDERCAQSIKYDLPNHLSDSDYRFLVEYIKALTIQENVFED